MGTELSSLGWVDLDSSTEAKFSRHVIVKTLAFEDNAAAGEFVQKFMIFLQDRAAQTDESAQSLFVRTCEGGEQTALFIDRCVYSRNRFAMFELSTRYPDVVALQRGWHKVTGPDKLECAHVLIPRRAGDHKDGLAPHT